MRKAAHPSGGVGSSNPRRLRGWRLHHHGDGVCQVFVSCVLVSSGCCHSSYVDKYKRISLRWSLRVPHLPSKLLWASSQISAVLKQCLENYPQECHQQRCHLAWHASGDGKETPCHGEDLHECVFFRMSNLHMIFLCIMIRIFNIQNSYKEMIKLSSVGVCLSVCV